MTVLKARDIEAALLSKGFQQDNTHHKYYWLYVRGRRTRIRTHLSHGSSDYGDALLIQVKKQMGITKRSSSNLWNAN